MSPPRSEIRVVVTGLGFVTSIGNSRAEVVDSLRTGRTGIALCEELAGPDVPVRLAGTVKGFEFPSIVPEDWSWPAGYAVPRENLRSMSPNVLYGYCAMQQAIEDAGLPVERVSHERTGLICASGGSPWLTYGYLKMMLEKGVLRCPPMGMAASIAGSLNLNLATCFGIQGSCFGVTSACASSAHALGTAFDQIRAGTQDVILVAGAEDCNLYSILPFAGVRALSTSTDPTKTPCAFDRHRDGFVVTGGATVLVLERLESARQRDAAIWAEIRGWADASDGYSVMAPQPEGKGLERAMKLALHRATLVGDEVDYLNAHGTSTVAGDAAEIAAIRRVFSGGRLPLVSSTKSLTGHGLSLAGALEAGICCLALREGFTPVSANIQEVDPAFAGVPIVSQPTEKKPRILMSNSSGFGGANVALVLQRWDES